LRHLAKRYDIKLIYPSFSPDDLRHVEELKKYCISVDTVQLNRFFAKLRCALGFFTNKPFTFYYFYSQAIHSIVRNMEFDIALVDCSSMASYMIDSRKPKIIDFIDVDYDKWRMYAEKAFFPKSIIYSMEYNKLKDFEIEISRIFDHSIVISENERIFLPNTSKVSIISNGVDVKYPNSEENFLKNSLIFMGAMNYFANVDGVLYFHKQVLPLIKRQVDNIQFIIAGMHPVKKIRKLASHDVVVTGYVPDIGSYIAQAAVCVVPLRIAKGLQNKVLEAMAMGVPVVATSEANRGIGAQDKKEIMLADTPVDFAQATVTLLQDAGLRQEMTANARRFILKHFDWETNLKKLDDIIAHLRPTPVRETLGVG
jgi:sugar transferase (PEP-CTERM/EpsH1 system associated)